MVACTYSHSKRNKMKPLKFSKNSWHYKVATKFGGLEAWGDLDFCEYVRSVLLGIFLLSMIAIICFAGLFALADWMAWVSAMIITGSMITPSEPATIITACWVIAFIIIGCVYGSRIYDNRKEARRLEAFKAWQAGGEYIPTQPGFITMAYRTLKEKTCFRVELH